MKDHENEEAKSIPGILVPLDKISDDALAGLIEEFILREGTDYGKTEYTLEQKHQQVKRQLLAHKIFVVFDPIEQSASIVAKENLPFEGE